MSSVQLQGYSSRLLSTSPKERFGMMWTWARQGVLRSKDFQELAEEMIERRAHQIAIAKLKEKEDEQRKSQESDKEQNEGTE